MKDQSFQNRLTNGLLAIVLGVGSWFFVMLHDVGKENAKAISELKVEVAVLTERIDSHMKASQHYGQVTHIGN